MVVSLALVVVDEVLIILCDASAGSNPGPLAVFVMYKKDVLMVVVVEEEKGVILSIEHHHLLQDMHLICGSLSFKVFVQH